MPDMETPSVAASRQSRVPGEVKHVGQCSRDDDTIGPDDGRNVWTDFPDMLSYKIGQVVATFRKQVRVVPAKLDLARVQEVCCRLVLSSSCGQTDGPAHVCNDLQHKKMAPCLNRGKRNEDVLNGRKGRNHVQMIVDTKDCTVCFNTRDAPGNPRHSRCVTSVAEASVYAPEGARPAELPSLDTTYGDDTDDGNDHAHDDASGDDNHDGNDANGPPTGSVDAAAGAVPQPVPGEAAEHWESQHDGQEDSGV